MKLTIIKLNSVVIESTKEDAVLLVAQNKTGDKQILAINPPMPERVSLGDTVEVELRFNKPKRT